MRVLSGRTSLTKAATTCWTFCSHSLTHKITHKAKRKLTESCCPKHIGLYGLICNNPSPHYSDYSDPRQNPLKSHNCSETDRLPVYSVPCYSRIFSQPFTLARRGNARLSLKCATPLKSSLSRVRCPAHSHRRLCAAHEHSSSLAGSAAD